MLTPDLVRARRKAGAIEVRPLSARDRESGLSLAASILAAYRGGQSRSRAELYQALADILVPARDRKLFLALKKRIDDQAEWSEGPTHDPIALRRAVFLRASEVRRATGTLDRLAVLGEIGAAEALSAEEADRRLFGDLREAQTLQKAPALNAEALLDTHGLAEAQAILLRAVEVEVELDRVSPAAARALFRKMKFLRLLFRLEEESNGKYRLRIDGPFSLFESVTKYGLSLALLLPALEAAERYTLSAALRWGKQKERLRFQHRGGRTGAPPEVVDQPEEVATLLTRLNALSSGFQVELADRLIPTQEAGVLVPDLRLVDRASGREVFVEILGHWSRDAVWRRVEAAPRLAAPMLFVVSQRLRVSEEVLPEEAPAALYVYKGVISAKTVLERAAGLIAAAPSTS
ncbi:MAG: DUF790 family protein [Myxococcota bacterium]